MITGQNNKLPILGKKTSVPILSRCIKNPNAITRTEHPIITYQPSTMQPEIIVLFNLSIKNNLKIKYLQILMSRQYSKKL